MGAARRHANGPAWQGPEALKRSSPSASLRGSAPSRPTSHISWFDRPNASLVASGDREMPVACSHGVACRGARPIVATDEPPLSSSAMSWPRGDQRTTAWEPTGMMKMLAAPIATIGSALLCHGARMASAGMPGFRMSSPVPRRMRTANTVDTRSFCVCTLLGVNSAREEM